MKASVNLLWYDLWVGAFWDRAKRVLYVCPLPCVVLKFQFSQWCHWCLGTKEFEMTWWHAATDTQRTVKRKCTICGGTGKVKP